jgi:diguanylate cyclase (GGDEF)-like protein
VIGAPLLASTELTAALIAVGVTAATLALVTLGGRLSKRSQASTEQRTADLVRELEARMEHMGLELSTALERTREETRRGRLLGDLAGSIDLEDVMRRTLDAAGAVPGADAAMVNVDNGDGDGEPVTASVGLSPEEIEEHSLGHSPRGRRIRSMVITYDPGLDQPGAAQPISVGLAVPIHIQLETVGVLSIFSRGESTIFSESQLRELEDVAAQAAPMIHNARRFREARQLADLDALTGLHNRRYFYETLAREVARAQRYSRRLGLLVFDLDDFKAINDQIGHLPGDSVLTEVSQRIRGVVRSADIPCRVGGDEFAVILPESGLEEADQLYRRLQAELSARPVIHAGRLLISAGVAELRGQEDSVSFFQRADEALYRAKGGGKGRAAS